MKIDFNSNILLSRSRTIHLLYLILLLLVFAFIPFNHGQNDPVACADLQSSASELEMISSQNAILLLHLYQDNPELFEELKYKCIDLERLADIPLEYIKYLKTLISPDSSRSANGEWLTSEQKDSLFRKIRQYRSSLLEILEYSEVNRIDKVIPANDFVENSKGELVPVAVYFFPPKAKRTTIAQNLAGLELAIVRSKNIGYDGILTAENQLNRSGKTFDDIKLSSSEQIQDITDQHSIQKFFDRLENIRLGRVSSSVDRGNFIVERLQGFQAEEGTLIKFRLHFGKGMGTMVVRVQSITDETTYTLNDQGLFVYFPKQQGLYTFRFELNGSVHDEQINISKTQGILSDKQIPTLYSGIENEINLRPVIDKERIKLEVHASSGALRKKDDQYFLTVQDAGMVTVEAFADMPYGRMLVDSKTYKVSNNIPIGVQFGSYANGSEIFSYEIKDLYFLTLVSDLELGSAELVDFQIFKITQGSGLVTPTITNYGPNFNPATRSLLVSCSTGDLVIINKIRARSPGGQILELKPYTVSVR